MPKLYFLQKKITLFKVSTLCFFRRIVSFIANFSRLGVLEPKRITTKRVALGLIEIDDDGKLSFKVLSSNFLSRKTTLFDAMQKVNSQEIINYKDIHAIIPFVIIENLNIFIESSSSLFDEGLSNLMEEDISSLLLTQPIELRHKNIRNYIAVSIVDFSQDRILFLGHGTEVLEYLKSIGRRIKFPKDKFQLIEKIKEEFSKHYITEFGTRKMIGVCATIFITEQAYAISIINSSSIIDTKLLMITIWSALPVLFFLTSEATEKNNVSFSPQWIIYPKTMSWGMIGVMLFVNLFLIIGLSDPDVMYLFVGWQFFVTFFVLQSAKCGTSINK